MHDEADGGDIVGRRCLRGEYGLNVIEERSVGFLCNAARGDDRGGDPQGANGSRQAQGTHPDQTPPDRRSLHRRCSAVRKKEHKCRGEIGFDQYGQ